MLRVRCNALRCRLCYTTVTDVDVQVCLSLSGLCTRVWWLPVCLSFARIERCIHSVNHWETACIWDGRVDGLRSMCVFVCGLSGSSTGNVGINRCFVCVCVILTAPPVGFSENLGRIWRSHLLCAKALRNHNNSLFGCRRDSHFLPLCECAGVDVFVALYMLVLCHDEWRS